MAELRRAQRETREDAVTSGQTARLWGTVRLGVGIAGWLFAGLTAVWSLTLLPLRRDVHHFTVLNVADNTAAVFDSTWDLPESKREALILGTSAQYVRACESYSWAEAQAYYDYCAGLSVGPARQDYVERVNPENKASPQAVLGQYGWKRIITGRPVRTAPNAITVPALIVVGAPNSLPVCARRLFRLTYAEVAKLPTTLHLHYPTADVMFVTSTPDEDPTPLDPSACHV